MSRNSTRRCDGCEPQLDVKLDVKKAVYLLDDPNDNGIEYYIAHFPDGTPIVDDDGDFRLFSKDGFLSTWSKPDGLTNVCPPWQYEFNKGGTTYVVSNDAGKLTINRK